MITMGKRLRQLRLERNLTMEMVAKKTLISETAIGYYELDKAEPTASRLLWLSDVYGVTIDYIVRGD